MKSTKTARAVLAFVVAAGLALAACTERSVAPPAAMDRVEEQRNLLGGLLGGVTQLLFSPLQRNTPLPQDVSWSFTVGPSGGSSTNSTVGLTINIPAGALSSTTAITVTALAGSPVAYRFEPHLTFNQTVHLTQNLAGTSTGLLGGLLMKGAHFSGSSPTYNSSGLALVDEIVSGIVLPGGQYFTFGITHFSGWIPGSGYMAEGSSEGQ